MTIYTSIVAAIIVMVAGVLMYALSVNPKLQEIGRISYFAGLLAFLLQVNSVIIR